MPTTAPIVLNRRHHSASSSAGNFTLEAKQNAMPTSTETLNPAPPASASAIASTPIPTAESFATQTSSFSESRPLRMTLDHRSCATAPDAEITSPATTARIVASATAEMTARKMSPPAEPSPPPRFSASSGIARLPVSPAAFPPAWLRIAARADADDHDHEVEGADQEHGPADRAARRLGVRHGEEAHEDVRQPGGAEHERDAERQQREAGVELQAGLEVRGALRVLLRVAREQLDRVEADLAQHEDRHHDAGGHQQRRLDDLHPRGGEHAAEDHVGEHEAADDDHGRGERDAGQRLDQRARADHLRDEVDQHDRERAGGGDDPRGALAQAERQHVGERELAGVAHPLGEEQQHRDEGDDRRHQADEGVDAEQEDEAGEAEERRGRHVVAGDRPAVLEAGDAAAGGVEVRGAAGALGGPVGDAERDGEDDAEDRQRQDLQVGGEDDHRAPPSSRAPRPRRPAARAARSRVGLAQVGPGERPRQQHLAHRGHQGERQAADVLAHQVRRERHQHQVADRADEEDDRHRHEESAAP